MANLKEESDKSAKAQSTRMVIVIGFAFMFWVTAIVVVIHFIVKYW
jgi:hypothetical protein